MINFIKSSKIHNVALHPVFISIFIALPIILLLPIPFSKYLTNFHFSKVVEKEIYLHYSDLNNDKSSEIVYGYNRKVDGSSVFVTSPNNVTINQWNLEGSLFDDSNSIFIDDYNDDGIKELFVLTVKNDSVYLWGIDVWGKSNFLFNRIYIDRIHKYKGEYDTRIIPCGFLRIISYDYKMLYFGLSSGYTLQPRNLYRVDVLEGKVIKSPESAAHIMDIRCLDINNDNKIEFYIENKAPGNLHSDSISVSDNYTWRILMDDSLNYISPPQKVGNFTSYIQFNELIDGEEKYLIQSFYCPDGLSSFNKLTKLNYRGNIILEKEYKIEDGSHINKLYNFRSKSSQNLYWGKGNGKLYLIKPDMTIQRIVDLKRYNSYWKNIDIDNDGEDEFYTYLPTEKKIVIFRNDFKYPANFQIPSTENNLIDAEVFVKKYTERGAEVIIKHGNLLFQFKYYKNPLYFLKFLIYFLIFFSIYVLVNFWRNRIERLLKEKAETEKKMIELQFSTLKNQLDPHFIFNVLNSMGFAIQQQEGLGAYILFNRFVTLIRMAVTDSQEMWRSLDEELEFVINYIEIQKNRFPDKFDYVIDVDPELDKNLAVPKMIIQLFVENAIKHGLLPKNDKGLLKIIVEQSTQNLIITIEDNGVGRRNAKELGLKSTGKGLEIVKKFMKIHNESSKNKISLHIEDIHGFLKSDPGTRVLIGIEI